MTLFCDALVFLVPEENVHALSDVPLYLHGPEFSTARPVSNR